MTTSIGIHIQEHNINIVEVSLNGTINKTHIIPLEPYDTQEQKHIQIAQQLRSLAKEHKKEAARFCFALPQNQVSFFKTQFPFREKFKLIKTLPFEIEDQSPFPSNRVFFDSRVSLKSRNNKYSVLCFLTPRERVQEYNEVIKDSKITPWLISAEGPALATLLEGLNPSPENAGSAVYIYLGWSESLALFFHEGNLETLSHISWGFQPVVEAMKKTYKLNTENAKKQFSEKAFILMEQKGFTKEQIFFSSLIKKEVGQLIEKLRFLQLSMETDTELKFQKVLLMGPGAVIKNLPSFLSRTFSIPFLRLKAVPQFPNWELNDYSNQTFLIPLGLALEGLRRPPYSGLNLMKSLNERKFLNFQKQWKKTLIAVGISFAVLTAYALIKNRESRQLADHIHSVFMTYGEKIAFLRSSKIHEEAVEDFLSKKESERNNKKQLESKLSKITPLDHLKTLTDILKPPSEWELKITALKIKKRMIDIEGKIHPSFHETLTDRLQSLAEANTLKKKELPPQPPKEETTEKATQTLDKNLEENDKQETPPPPEETHLESFSYSFKMKR